MAIRSASFNLQKAKVNLPVGTGPILPILLYVFAQESEVEKLERGIDHVINN